MRARPSSPAPGRPATGPRARDRARTRTAPRRRPSSGWSSPLGFTDVERGSERRPLLGATGGRNGASRRHVEVHRQLRFKSLFPLQHSPDKPRVCRGIFLGYRPGPTLVPPGCRWRAVPESPAHSPVPSDFSSTRSAMSSATGSTTNECRHFVDDPTAPRARGGERASHELVPLPSCTHPGSPVGSNSAAAWCVERNPSGRVVLRSEAH